VTCQQQLPSAITVTVNDQYNAGWQISWSGAASGSQSGSSSDTFTVQPTSNGAVTFTASITSNPSGYQCTISPSSTTAYPGQSVTFTVSCQPVAYYVYVTVTGDSYGAGWQISSSVNSISGISNVNNQQLQIGGQTDTLTAQITSNPPGYSCSITPTSEQVSAGNSYTFTVSCQPIAYYVYVTVTGDNYGAEWVIASSISFISGANNVNNQQLQIGGQTDTLWAGIISNPNGYACSISPSMEQVTAGNTYTFTVSCQPDNNYIYVTVTNDTLGAEWLIASSVSWIYGSNNTNNEQLQIGGSTDWVTAMIVMNPPGYTCTITPTSEQVSAGDSYTFTVNCYVGSSSSPWW
jgi:hypothetical protein